MHGRRGASQVKDAIYFNQHRLDDIVAHELEVAVVQQGCDVLTTSGKEVVEAEHLVSLVQESLAEMGANKAGAASDQCSHGAEGYSIRDVGVPRSVLGATPNADDQSDDRHYGNR